MTHEPLRPKMVALVAAHIERDRENFPADMSVNQRANWIVDEIYDEIYAVMRRFHEQFAKEFDLT